MVFGTGAYEPIISGYYERLQDVPVPVVYKTSRGLYQASYNGVLFLAGDKVNAERRYTWKYVASETTTSG